MTSHSDNFEPPQPTGRQVDRETVRRKRRGGLGPVPRPDLALEDRARLVWVASQLECGPRELMSLAMTWIARELQMLITHERFSKNDLQRWREDFVLVANRAEHFRRTVGFDPRHANKLGYILANRPDLYQEARRRVGELFGVDGDRIPEWILREAIWGRKPPGYFGEG